MVLQSLFSIFFYKSGYYNVKVEPKDGESEEQLVNDFRRSVYRAGVLQETRKGRFFESSQEKRKRKPKKLLRRIGKGGQTLNQNHIQPLKPPRAEMLAEMLKKMIKVHRIVVSDIGLNSIAL